MYVFINDFFPARSVIKSILDEVVEKASSSPEDKYIKLFIESVCWSGTWVFYVSLDTKISQIKMMALSELDFEKFEMRSSLYTLIYPEGQRILQDSRTVAEEKIEDNSK